MGKRRIDIIGAGISGLATAYYLNKFDHPPEIHVWERTSTAGGLAGCFQADGFTIEKFYHHLYKRDLALQELIGEVGLSDQLEWKPASTGAYYFRQPFRLSTPLDLLKFTPLPLGDRLRFGLLMLQAKTVQDWQSLDDISIKEYIVRYAGKNVYDIVWLPLLKGKFGPYAEKISAAWLWAKLVDRGGSRSRSGFELLGYLKGGLGKLFAKIIDELKVSGQHIHLGAPIQGLELDGQNRIKYLHTAEGKVETDCVVSCVQLPDLVRMLPDMCQEYKTALSKIKFLANVCLVLTLKKSLSMFYWTNVTDPQAPFVGIIEQTRWADLKEFDNKHLVYISAYVAENDPRLHWTPEKLLEHYLPHIQKLFPHFRKEDVCETYRWSELYTQPIIQVGYRHVIPAIQSPLKNLLVCTMAQIYPSDRQVSNGVEMARKTVESIKETIFV